VAIPHPVNSAGGFQGRDPDAPFLIEGSYLDAAPADWVLDREGITVTFHSEHRPLEAYSRAGRVSNDSDQDSSACPSTSISQV
jgi:hypothetical protein